MGTYACFVIGREGVGVGFWLCKPLYNVFVIVEEKGDFEQIADCFEYVQSEIFGSGRTTFLLLSPLRLNLDIASYLAPLYRLGKTISFKVSVCITNLPSNP